jgi:cytochrome c-type biogenesis protein CcmE
MRTGGGKRKAALALTLVVILSGFGYLLYGGIGENIVYFLTPKELLARGVDGVDKPVRLGGQVVPGSVKWDAQALDLRFRVTDGEREIPVHSTGSPPQMFRDGIGVVVEGRFNRAGLFESTSLMVKHSNEYRAPKAGEHPREVYKSLIKEGRSS